MGNGGDHEPVYDKEHSTGRDWIVRDGSTIVLIECTGSEPDRSHKTGGERRQIARRSGGSTSTESPEVSSQIDALRSGERGDRLRGIDRFIPVIVSRTRWYVEPVVPRVIREVLENHDENV
jgi:hypothetical protein